MSDEQTVTQATTGLNLAHSKVRLMFGLLMCLAAIGSSAFSLSVTDDLMQIVPCVTIFVIGTIGAYFKSLRMDGLDSEAAVQMMLSLVAYVVVCVGGFGFVVAVFAGPSVGVVRTAFLYASSLGLLLSFALILVRTAIRDRKRYYCFGLALSPLLASLLLPGLQGRTILASAHGILAVGYLAAVATQWIQIKQTDTLKATEQ